MRKRIILFLACLTAALPARAAPKLTIATEGVAPPFNYFQGKTLTGFEVEVANEVAKRMGRSPDWLTFRFDSLLIGLAQGRYDLVVASHTPTPERAKAVDFSAPHYCTGAVVVTRDKSVKTREDLKGKTVSVTLGTTYMQYAKDIPGIGEIKTYPNQNDGMQAMLSGRVDAWMIDKFVAIDVLKTPQGKGLSVSALVVPEQCAFALKKGNKKLLEAVNAKLSEILADGTYERISKKYFGEDIRCR